MLRCWNNVRVALFRLWWWLWFRSGLWYRYSRIVRWVVEHRHRHGDPPLTQYRSYLTLLDAAQRWRYRRDGWRQGGDCCSYPSAVQARINDRRQPTTEIGDCEDWAIYLSQALADVEHRAQIFDGWRCRFSLLTFALAWYSFSGRAAFRWYGHTVCLVTMRHRHSGVLQYGYSSNWTQGRIVTGTYDGRPFESIEDVVAHHLGEITGPSGGCCQLLGWVMADDSLRRIAAS